ncbi:cupin domain-containing protein [Frankia sp. CiP3]|uniref:cupin domain-containing protein n=1 Tax=Frankia sp. CiP3 TaxID=2880971 RepID=UPI0035B2525C
MRNVFRVGLAGAAALGFSLVSSTAGATPSSGVTGTIIAQATAGGKDYILRKITVQPGGSTGWHYHDGTLYAIVVQGTLTHSDSTCATDGVYDPGSIILESSGANHVHIGRNLGSKPLILEVLYVDPAGSPLAEDASNPGCDFQ